MSILRYLESFVERSDYTLIGGRETKEWISPPPNDDNTSAGATV